MKDFAPDWPRNDQGWILFPWNDTDYRSQMFPQEVNKHPAKANMYLIQSIVEYVSEPESAVVVTPELLAALDKEMDWCLH